MQTKDEKYAYHNLIWYPKNKKSRLKQIKIYQQTKKGKEVLKKAKQKYRNSKHGQLKEYKYRQSNIAKISHKKALLKYNKTEKGQICEAKKKGKRNRKLGFNILFENIINEKTDWHHINNKDVVAIPQNLHRIYNTRNIEEHRFMCNQIIKQIYIRG